MTQDELDMQACTLDNWWASLSISERNRIANKLINKQNSAEGQSDTEIDSNDYASASKIWTGLSMEVKQKIHDHCTDRHGLLMKEWKEGKGMSY